MNPTHTPQAAGKPAHTPTPWIIQQFGPYRDISITTPRNECRIPMFETVVEVWTKNGTPRDRAEANAAFIVTACNSYAALVEALEGLLKYVESRNAINWRAVDEDEGSKARAALALAKGGTQ